MVTDPEQPKKDEEQINDGGKEPTEDIDLEANQPSPPDAMIEKESSVETQGSNVPTEHGSNVCCEDKEQAIPEEKRAEIEAAEAISQHQRSRHSRHSSWQSPARIGNIYRATGEGDICPVVADPSSNAGQKYAEPEGDATWKDVAVACCCHSFQEWMNIFLGILSLMTCLYLFLLGLDLLGTSFRVVGGCTAGSMLGSDANPLASVIIGIIATALLQSSSTTTAIIVTLVSGGLDVHAGIYMVMGANIGTRFTCMLVSMAHIGDKDELERAFSSSATLFTFNFLTVLLLFPIEVVTGYLYHFTKIMLPDTVGEGEKWEGPIKKIVSPLGNRIIMANKDLIAQVSDGERTCASYYPVICADGDVSYDSCYPGLIGCDKKTNSCPFFFQANATKKDDMISGWVCLVLSLLLLIFCLIGLVALLRKMLLGASERIIYKATSINEYLAMIIGCGVTILVQSSSITSSALVPLAGVGLISIEQMLPLIMGADIGTTCTALLAAMVSSKVEALQIALVHLFFNVTGVLIWYPIPYPRRLLLGVCRLLGRITAQWRGFPAVFIVFMYFLLPLLLLGISSCFEAKTKGLTALGVCLVLFIFCALVYAIVWWRYRGGRKKIQRWIIRRQRKAAAIASLADDLDYLKVDMEYVKNEVGRLKDFAGLARIETNSEGVPILVLRPPRHHDIEDEAAGELDDLTSLYESTHSLPWQKILVGAARSIHSGRQ